jgi:glycosyltransferase involved in cell wall biosynthesis
MNSNPPLVSVIIPVYNCDRYLAEAIESVLAQTYRSIEIIVIDDGSTDNSATVAASFGSLVRYYFHQNSGLGASRNRGIELANGEFCAFVDSDDLWTEDKLSLQMAAFDANPQLDIVFGLVQQFISPELDENIQSLIHCPSAPMAGLSCLSMLIKRATFYQVGLFETGWKLGEFIDWYAKAIEQDLVSYTLPKLVAKRRLHDANMGISDRHHRGDYVRIIKAALDRRRTAKLS